MNGRSIRAYVNDTHHNAKTIPACTDSLEKQVQQLTDIVQSLSHKVDNIVCGAVRPPPLDSTIAWPRLSVKRRRKEIDQTSLPASDQGTKTVDLSGLSVPFITPAAAPQKFWLYLTGFQPLITTDDVQTIVSRCLELTSPVDIIRLVPKGKDVSNMTFVSFKIGLDPAFKESALDADSWPTGIMFREFVELPKNT